MDASGGVRCEVPGVAPLLESSGATKLESKRRRVYAIGDVQGCLHELHLLLDKIHFSPEKDQLWFAGDLVNRGPDSLGVLRFVKSLQTSAVTVLGNHDLHLLAVAYGVRPHRDEDTLHPILSAPDRDELLDWLRARPLLHYNEGSQALMVHAGLPLQWDLSAAQSHASEVENLLQGERYLDFFQHMYGREPIRWRDDLEGWDRARFIVNALTRMRFCDLTGALDFDHTGPVGSAKKGLVPWYELPGKWRASKINILFGHWAALEGKTDQDKVIALDTGCVWGKRLSAYCLDDKKWFSVDRLT